MLFKLEFDSIFQIDAARQNDSVSPLSLRERVRVRARSKVETQTQDQPQTSSLKPQAKLLLTTSYTSLDSCPEAKIRSSSAFISA